MITADREFVHFTRRTCLPRGARGVPRDRSMSLRLSAVRREFLI